MESMKNLTGKTFSDLYDDRAYTLARITNLLEVCRVATLYSPSKITALENALSGEYVYLDALTDALTQKRGDALGGISDG